MKHNKNTIIYLGLIVSFIYFIVSCTKTDDYRKQFMSGGSISYTGKMDSVAVLSGLNRVMVTGLFTSDPNIVKYVVYWLGGQDSVVVPFKRSFGVDTIKLIIPNLPEGTMSFTIKTYDSAGHSSIPVYATGTVYGSNYQNSIIDRGIVSSGMQTNGSALITWADVNASAGVKNMEIKYSDNNNVLRDTIIPAVTTGQTSVLPDYLKNTSFTYSTAYLPDSTAIDTFHTVYQSYFVSVDVTSVYLSNYTNFSGTNIDGRFGYLNAPWITNAPALNKTKNGVAYGGWSTDSRWGLGGSLTFETWNNTAYSDGKMYQVSSDFLPAGTYTASIYYYSEVQQNSSVYFIAAAGDKGIPSIADLSSGLGSVELYNGANNGGTSPNREELKSFTFTITTPQVVSIGLLSNLTVNNYFLGEYIQLIRNS